MPITRGGRLSNRIIPSMEQAEPIRPQEGPGPVEYDILEQLKKTQARISIFDLINSSAQHQKAVQEVLEKAQVASDMPVEACNSHSSFCRVHNYIC